MDVSFLRFRHLLNEIEGFVMNHNIHFCKSISAEERLVVTLIFIAIHNNRLTIRCFDLIKALLFVQLIDPSSFASMIVWNVHLYGL